MKKPLVSFVILNWNGRKRLAKCLASVEKIKYSPFEIVVVNNGSTDDSAEFLKKNYPKIRVIEFKKNVGYARGKNTGVKKANGKYILALDNDTVVTPGFLSPLVEDLEKNKDIGIVQPQIRSMIDKKILDSVVSYFTFSGFLYHLGYMKPYNKEIYQIPLFAYGIKGACFLIRKNDYEKLGGMDESFFAYVEETDLCHRIWLSGKKVFYDPRGVIYHWGGGDSMILTKSEVTIFRSFRNRITSYIKNLSVSELMKLLPVHILLCEMFAVILFLKLDYKRGFAVQLGILYPFFNLQKILSKRRHIQRKLRKVSDKKIMPFITRNPKFSYYLYLSKDNLGEYPD